MTKHPDFDTLSLAGITAVIRSESMRHLLATVERVARTHAAVLITGESGSGKELIARAIHHYSLRCTKPLVDFNCAALPEHLVESELFGYEKGAFSGADAAKPGLFELANTGTMFMDEIAEVDPKTQVKLLRVLDGVPYYRLGGQKKVSTDVRIVAATNQRLEEAVSAGKFRGDLYHRLNQIHIHVPSLRERPEDMVGLAEYFLRAQSERAVFSMESMQALVQYSWPGNVRELRNAVLKAAMHAKGFEIGLSDLPPEITGYQPAAVASGEALSCRLDVLEQQTILKVLSETGGHHQRAAELLGISRRTLTRKLKSYGMATAPAPAFA